MSLCWPSPQSTQTSPGSGYASIRGDTSNLSWCAHTSYGFAVLLCRTKPELTVQVDKHEFISRLGIYYRQQASQADLSKRLARPLTSLLFCRDLRIVDPLIPTPYPTALFIRERAMVVNFESIRMIIAADQVCPDAGSSKKALSASS